MVSRDIVESELAFRFLDVDQESLKIFPPIPDYDNTPLVSIDKAIIPLEPIVPCIKSMLQTVKMMNSNEPKDGLTRDEAYSIRLYTFECSLFDILNKTLRSDNRQRLKPWLLFLRLFFTALSHISSTTLVVYRGINMDLSKLYPMGATIVWNGFSSCIKMTTQLENKLFLNKTGKRTLFVINCYSSKSIYQYSTYESALEVLLLPGRQFVVFSCVNQGKDLYVIELNEIEPAFEFTDAVTTSCSIQNVDFRPISTVSLSKKTLPATLPNHRLEEALACSFTQRLKFNFANTSLDDTDMDTIISEIIIYRGCHELNLSKNNFTYKGISILAQILEKNKVASIFFCIHLNI